MTWGQRRVPSAHATHLPPHAIINHLFAVGPALLFGELPPTLLRVYVAIDAHWVSLNGHHAELPH